MTGGLLRDVIPSDDADIETFDDRNIIGRFEAKNGEQFEGGEIISPSLLREALVEYEKEYGTKDARVSLVENETDDPLTLLALRPHDSSGGEAIVLCTKVQP